MELQPNLQKQIDLGSSGLDVMHGHLKVIMVDAEDQLRMAQEQEDETEEAIDSMERKYWEGQMDALSWVYALTYQLSFAISDRAKKNG